MTEIIDFHEQHRPGPAQPPRVDPATVDLARWPALAAVPTGPKVRVAAAVARRLYRAGTHRLGVRDTDLVVHRPDAFFSRLGSDHLIGLGESYLAGDWDAEDLGGVLTTLCTEIGTLVPQWMQRLRAAYVARPPRHQANTEDNTRANIAHHYDLSNDLFALFLDETMSYSAALYADPADRTEPLETAQERKIERILDEAGVGAGTRVLEIGTGWGELALRAARRGAVVRSVTLSSEQQLLARERIAAAGCSDRVHVDLLDYRFVDGQYDAVVSVEMIEAVGWEYWPTYFAKIDSLLAPGGTAVLQAITMPHDRMLATRRTWTWINKYIFPGGFLPSVEALEEVAREHTTLRLAGGLSFGRHYAETLRRWDEAFLAATDDVLALGFDETFIRMWHFYLEYSRAGFAASYLDVQQLTFRREDDR